MTESEEPTPEEAIWPPTFTFTLRGIILLWAASRGHSSVSREDADMLCGLLGVDPMTVVPKAPVVKARLKGEV